ncbi:MAG: TerB family tellurite resistance protein [Sandaracinaceae bacterium]|nr:TerB family tellurite resistance protein [Sandaracinaceae bacterium]
MPRDRILTLTDLLLGALYADHEFTADEQRAVRQLLADLLSVTPDTLPANVEERIRTFDPLRFDLVASAHEFRDDPPNSKRRLLELVGRMVNADGVVELREDEYLRELAAHLGLEYSDYHDLVLDHDIEELRGHFDKLRAPPPPMVHKTGQSSRPPPPPMVDIAPPSVPSSALVPGGRDDD